MGSSPKLPGALTAGDTVAIVAPASPPRVPDAIAKARQGLTAAGYRVVVARHARARAGYLAGTDAQRAASLERAWLDPLVKAVFCLRGGYGCSRILPLLHFKAWTREPKILIGFSDVTALLCAMDSQARLVGFHGPLLDSTSFADPAAVYSRAMMLKILSGDADGLDLLETDPARSSIVPIRKGRCRGRLLGGNLSVLCSLVGTRWLPPAKGRIVFLEEVGEPPYRVDRMLTTLLQSGWLGGAAGIALGQFTRCTDPVTPLEGERRQTVFEVLKERLGPLRIPILANLPFGHVMNNATVPVGVGAELDARNIRLTLLSNGAIKE